MRTNYCVVIPIMSVSNVYVQSLESSLLVRWKRWVLVFVQFFGKKCKFCWDANYRVTVCIKSALLLQAYWWKDTSKSVWCLVHTSYRVAHYSITISCYRHLCNVIIFAQNKRSWLVNESFDLKLCKKRGLRVKWIILPSDRLKHLTGHGAKDRVSHGIEPPMPNVWHYHSPLWINCRWLMRLNNESVGESSDQCLKC